MSFGDFIAGVDSTDTAPPDPEAVARILVGELRATMPGGFRQWAGHTPAEQAAWINAVRHLLARLHDEGPA